MILSNYYNATQAVLATFLLVMYTATLIRVCRGRKFSFVVKLIILMMFSNIALISGSVSNYEESLKEKASIETTLFMWTAAVSFGVRDATFNVAHWMFAFEYYSISRYMPYLLMKTTPSRQMIRCDELINKILMFFNVLAPIMSGSSLLLYNLCDINFEPPNAQTD